jgi:hypothetical protein
LEKGKGEGAVGPARPKGGEGARGWAARPAHGGGRGGWAAAGPTREGGAAGPHGPRGRGRLGQKGRRGEREKEKTFLFLISSFFLYA